MLDTLLASRAPGERRTAGTLVSILLHSGAIALAMVSTVRAGTRPRHDPAPPKLVYAAPPPSRPAHANPAAAGAAARRTIDVEGLTPPAIGPVKIPRGIPTPDLSRAIHDGHLFDGGTPSLGGVVDGEAGAMTSPADGVWTEALVDRPVLARPDNPTPRYPEALRAARVEGSVVAHFVVDSTGRVEPASIAFGDATHPRFAAAVREALLHSRFVPAEAGGRRVRQLVEQRFLFELAR